MSKQPPDFETLVDALRADLPGDADRERVRARLLAAGVAVGAGAAMPSAAAAASAGSSGAAGAAGAAHAGVLGQVASMSTAAKLGALALVIAAGAGAPLVLHVLRAAPEKSVQGSKASPAAPAPAVVREPAAREVPAVTAPSGAASENDDAARAVAPAVPRRAPAAPVLKSHATAVAPAAAAAEPAAAAAEPTVAAAAPTATAEPTTPAVAPTPSALRDEADLLGRALSALRAGDREGARAALAAHAQRYPHGTLARERERLVRRIK